jgi:hypothetical protein
MSYLLEYLNSSSAIPKGPQFTFRASARKCICGPLHFFKHQTPGPQEKDHIAAGLQRHGTQCKEKKLATRIAELTTQSLAQSLELAQPTLSPECRETEYKGFLFPGIRLTMGLRFAIITGDNLEGSAEKLLGGIFARA